VSGGKSSAAKKKSGAMRQKRSGADKPTRPAALRAARSVNFAVPQDRQRVEPSFAAAAAARPCRSNQSRKRAYPQKFEAGEKFLSPSHE